jgi:hypothetical protein
MTTATVTSPGFLALSIPQQAVFIGKLVVFVATMGFAFPRVLSD